MCVCEFCVLYIYLPETRFDLSFWRARFAGISKGARAGLQEGASVGQHRPQRSSLAAHHCSRSPARHKSATAPKSNHAAPQEARRLGPAERL